MPSSKSIRFDEEGNAIKTESGVRDINEVEGELSCLILMCREYGH